VNSNTAGLEALIKAGPLGNARASPAVRAGAQLAKRVVIAF
jgi:hypothetical protein